MNRTKKHFGILVINYSKSTSLENQRNINVSVRLNAVVKKWLDRQRLIEKLSLSSYIYEILIFSNSKPDIENPHDDRKELPYLAQIHEAYGKYLQLYNVSNNQFEEKISIYLDESEMDYIDDLACIYKTDVSDIIREHLHFFFIADNYFKTNFDLVDGLHKGLVMSHIKNLYYMQRFSPIAV